MKHFEDFKGFEVPEVNFDFSLDLDIKNEPALKKPKKWIVTEPRNVQHCPQNMVKAKYAKDFAAQVDLPQVGQEVTCITSGYFVFGDILEALASKFGRIHCLTISTLSMSDANVDMLARMIRNEQLDHLNLLISVYFHAHERRGTFQRLLDSIHPDCMKIGVAAIHTKTMCIDCEAGHFVISGSANLRSSSSIEQFTITHSDYYHYWHTVWMMQLIEKSLILKKPTTKATGWEAINI
jgi:ACT domain-containing protein